MTIASQTRSHKPWAPCGKRENWQDYYFERPASQDYGDYWGEITDPDGNARQRDTYAERFQYLADVADEIKWCNAQQPSGVLDIGAGLGWMLEQIFTPFKAAIEESPQAREALKRQGVTVLDNIRDVHYGCCNLVVAHHVIEHIPDPISWINDVRSIMEPGAKLLLATPDFGSPCAIRFGDRYRMLHDKTHCSLFTCESMHRFLRDFGLKIDMVRFPFPDRYATAENMQRWLANDGISPPWPGNWMTFYCTR